VTVIVAQQTPDAVRGLLKRWFIEPRGDGPGATIWFSVRLLTEVGIAAVRPPSSISCSSLAPVAALECISETNRITSPA